MERTDVLVAFKLDFSELIHTPNDNIMTYEIGLLSIIGLILTPFTIKKLKKQKYSKTNFYRLYIFSLIVGIISLIMTLKIFPFENLPSILKMMQFSFRMLEFSSFFLAFVVAVNFGIMIKNIKIKDISVILIILMVLTCFYIPHLHYIDNFDENKLWPAIPLTKNTLRVHAGMASMEYLPSKAFENREYIESRGQLPMILKGNGIIENVNKNNSDMTFDVKYVLEETNIELPYIYYLGYEVILENKDEKVRVKTYETDNGFIGIKIPILENGKIEVQYEGTVGMKISSIISIIGICYIIGINIIKTKRTKD